MDVTDSKELSTNSEIIDIDKQDFCEVDLDLEVARLWK